MQFVSDGLKCFLQCLGVDEDFLRVLSSEDESTFVTTFEQLCVEAGVPGLEVEVQPYRSELFLLRRRLRHLGTTGRDLRVRLLTASRLDYYRTQSDLLAAAQTTSTCTIRRTARPRPAAPDRQAPRRNCELRASAQSSPRQCWLQSKSFRAFGCAACKV